MKEHVIMMYMKKFIGELVEVLTEEYDGEYVVGHTSNYLKVFLKGDYLLNKDYICKIEELKDNKLYAKVLSCENEKINI